MNANVRVALRQVRESPGFFWPLVYQATPRDPMVLAGVVLAMMVVGPAATWIPAGKLLRSIRLFSCATNGKPPRGTMKPSRL